nr:MAG TPA: hypothetical protein [Caudoviricetes sp.]
MYLFSNTCTSRYFLNLGSGRKVWSSFLMRTNSL